jgi:hypothetical protein
MIFSIVTTVILGVSLSYTATLDILKYKNLLAPKKEEENKVGEVEGETTVKSKIIGHHMFANSEEGMDECHQQAMRVSRERGIPLEYLLSHMCKFDKTHRINNDWYFF